ncbi:uncharacterized protein METZ01_LOCUS64939 [marine metagenome]|uniref:Uncharacterized protein n=1 Tax=marine metagenome TaxID=408172 RepID=A0A381T7E4_9ZZZZ
MVNGSGGIPMDRNKRKVISNMLFRIVYGSGGIKTDN